MPNCIRYAKGYKYQLRLTYIGLIGIKPEQDIITEYIRLGTDGNLTIMEGYAWDGPSGPTIDTPDFMRGSLIHDALYQLMREKHLDHDTYREAADLELKKACLEDGMWSIRAWGVHQAVRLFGSPAADPAKLEPDVCAPHGCMECGL